MVVLVEIGVIGSRDGGTERLVGVLAGGGGMVKSIVVPVTVPIVLLNGESEGRDDGTYGLRTLEYLLPLIATGVVTMELVVALDLLLPCGGPFVEEEDE